jgi:hypothetical protein
MDAIAIKNAMQNMRTLKWYPIMASTRPPTAEGRKAVDETTEPTLPESKDAQILIKRFQNYQSHY